MRGGIFIGPGDSLAYLDANGIGHKSKVLNGYRSAAGGVCGLPGYRRSLEKPRPVGGPLRRAGRKPVDRADVPDNNEDDTRFDERSLC